MELDVNMNLFKLIIDNQHISELISSQDFLKLFLELQHSESEIRVAHAMFIEVNRTFSNKNEIPVFKSSSLVFYWLDHADKLTFIYIKVSLH